MQNTIPISLFWFRRDFRLEDNAGLYQALIGEHPVLPLFIFDKNILDKLEDKADRRVEFIHQCIQNLKNKFQVAGSDLLVEYGDPLNIFKSLQQKLNIKAVFTNEDYEPYAQKRDRSIQQFLQEQGIAFQAFKDQTIFHKQEILTGDEKPYSVFTPYSKKWKATLSEKDLRPYPSIQHLDHLAPLSNIPPEAFNGQLILLEEMGFEPLDAAFPSSEIREDIIKTYDETRDFPAVQGTTRLSVHLRFGTISIRNLVAKAKVLNEKWLNELIWRDFYMMILANFPHSAERAFRSKYDHIPWRNNQAEFEAWCQGKTGYPIVDAGMRELNHTGYMHNRIRMVTASFLTKHLLIDWRWGEAYFAKKLLDYELASNVGGWQWAAGSGVDAAPYFRIFNPESQTKKFDKDLKYIKKWIPELNELSYPKPIVDHKLARARALKTYKEALDQAN